MGYIVQRRALRKLLSTIFPNVEFKHEEAYEIFNLFGSSTNFPTVKIWEWDHALNHTWRLEHENAPDLDQYLQMARLKMGNPQVFSFDQKMLRRHFHIPEVSRVASLYVSPTSFEEIDLLLDRLPQKPDYFFISISQKTTPQVLKNYLPDHEILILSELSLHGSPLPPHPSRPVAILNDSRGRMPEIHAMSDYAVVMGPNNFFEPLMVKRPTLIYPGASPRVWKYYSRPVYAEMVATAVASGGAIGIWDLDHLNDDYRKLMAIKPEAIEHPAWVKKPFASKTGLELLLDRIEFMICKQIGTHFGINSSETESCKFVF